MVAVAIAIRFKAGVGLTANTTVRLLPTDWTRADEEV